MQPVTNTMRVAQKTGTGISNIVTTISSRSLENKHFQDYSISVCTGGNAFGTSITSTYILNPNTPKGVIKRGSISTYQNKILSRLVSS
jgi:hypothetical protein